MVVGAGVVVVVVVEEELQVLVVLVVFGGPVVVVGLPATVVDVRRVGYVERGEVLDVVAPALVGGVAR